MKCERVLLLVHEDLIPPPDRIDCGPDDPRLEFQTEHDVYWGLRDTGHDVRVLGVRYELAPIRQAVKRWQPQIVFNLLEEFRDMVNYDQHVVSYLELLGTPYTGCNPRGLTLARDKALSKKILHYHRLPIPRFAVFHRGRRAKRPKRLPFPLFVKALNQEASLGIAKASLVDTDDKLEERVQFIHERIGTDAIAEQFIPGREIYVGVLGNQRLRTLPVWELLFRNKPDDEPLIATAKAKWDLAYQQRWGITHGPAKDLEESLSRHIQALSKRIYRRLGLSGYARIDFRLDKNGDVYFLEANPNPDISAEEEFAAAANAAGLPYPRLLKRILSLGLRNARPTAEERIAEGG